MKRLIGYGPRTVFVFQPDCKCVYFFSKVEYFMMISGGRLQKKAIRRSAVLRRRHFSVPEVATESGAAV